MLLLFLVGHTSIVVLGQLCQVVVPASLVLDFGGLNWHLHVAVEHLISVEILNHHVQIVLIILQNVRRLALVGVFENAPVPADVPVAITVSQGCNTLRILANIASVPIVDLVIPLRIVDMRLDAQNLATANI